ncbi:isochorismatase/Phenazine biosynthesis protein PhzD [Tsukamurella sp. TY48]|uniref:isochorismatase family protein n=1 Tax=Tsukamurella sp. TY48 TaxID=2775495 RepID=UPI001C7CA904|nr:isochorismatase family protein [Tsukamurella sp. TY48]GIZ97075.1 isochorismatase/Phenazine biosynthesis protein PhzD [Tsukamurella sp. TY48]
MTSQPGPDRDAPGPDRSLGRRHFLRTAALGAAVGAVGVAAAGQAGSAGAAVAPPGSVSYRIGEIPIPKNKVAWRVDPRRAALLVHDVQLYFTRIFAEPTKQELLRNAARVQQWARSNQVPVAYSAQRGGATREQRGLIYDFSGAGMSSDESDRGIEPAVAPRPGERVLTKHKLSEYFRSDLLEYLRSQGRDQLILVGVYANTGVLLTAADSVQNDIQAFVVGDAVADQTPNGHRDGLAWVAARAGSVVTTAAISG